MHSATIDTPIGPIGLYADGDSLVRIHLPGERGHAPPAGIAAPDHPVLAAAAAQLAAYFAGERPAWSALPLCPRGTPFQREVWQALREIPYGETRSYADIARAIGRPAAVRAVGAANGKNPLPIVVPCHRVIGAGGSLVGFGGGLDAKAWLLAHEARTGQLQLAL